MSEFKVGDRVVCADAELRNCFGRGLVEGREYTVLSVNATGDIRVIEGGESLCGRRFRPAPPAPEAEEPQPGDRWETDYHDARWREVVIVRRDGVRPQWFCIGSGIETVFDRSHFTRRLSKAETGPAPTVATATGRLQSGEVIIHPAQPVAEQGEAKVDPYKEHRLSLEHGSGVEFANVPSLEQRIASAKDQHLRDLDRGRAERERNVRHWPEAFSTPGWEEP